MKKFLVTTILLASIAGGCGTQNDAQGGDLEIFYSHATKEGLFFIEPKAGIDNSVFVPYDAWSEWVGTSPDTLQHGEKYTGTFDSTGVELLDIAK